MKQIVTFIFSLISICSFAGDTTKLYNPNANAEADLKKIVAQAKQENKHVFIQAGGNWCGWCREFARFTKEDAKIDSLIKADYIVYHLNYSKENKNEKVFAKYGYAGRFGYPVFIILDERGQRIHTQNSVYLEKGKSYDDKKVFEFLSQWNYSALHPKE